MDELGWDPAGPAAILHAINRPRVDFYLKELGDLTGRRVLDAGCGGGLVGRGLAGGGGGGGGPGAAGAAVWPGSWTRPGPRWSGWTAPLAASGWRAGPSTGRSGRSG